MKASGDYFVTVIEDTRKNEIIGAASLVIERKFIHNCAVVSSHPRYDENQERFKYKCCSIISARSSGGCGCQRHLSRQTIGKAVSVYLYTTGVCQGLIKIALFVFLALLLRFHYWLNIWDATKCLWIARINLSNSTKP